MWYLFVAQHGFHVQLRRADIRSSVVMCVNRFAKLGYLGIASFIGGGGVLRFWVTRVCALSGVMQHKAQHKFSLR